MSNMEEKRKSVVTIGEIVSIYEENDKNNFSKSYFSEDFDISVCLQNIDCIVSFLTILPNNAFSKNIEDFLKEQLNEGSYSIIKKNGREGAIIKLKSEKELINDRKYSAFYFSSILDFDFYNIFKKATNFHFSMDTYSINKETEKMILTSLKEAKKAGIKVSVDMFSNNLYRRNIDSIACFNKFSKNIACCFVDLKFCKDVLKNESAKTDEEIIKRMFYLIKTNVLVLIDEENRIILENTGRQVKTVEISFDKENCKNFKALAIANYIKNYL